MSVIAVLLIIHSKTYWNDQNVKQISELVVYSGVIKLNENQECRSLNSSRHFEVTGPVLYALSNVVVANVDS